MQMQNIEVYILSYKHTSQSLKVSFDEIFKTDSIEEIGKNAVKVIPGEAGFRTDCLKIWIYNTKDIISQTSIVVSCPSGICLQSIPRYSFVCNLMGNMQKSWIINKVQTKKFLNFTKCKCDLQFI